MHQRPLKDSYAFVEKIFSMSVQAKLDFPTPGLLRQANAVRAARDMAIIALEEKDYDMMEFAVDKARKHGLALAKELQKL